jgi:hypothetical protein
MDEKSVVQAASAGMCFAAIVNGESVFRCLRRRSHGGQCAWLGSEAKALDEEDSPPPTLAFPDEFAAHVSAIQRGDKLPTLAEADSHEKARRLMEIVGKPPELAQAHEKMGRLREDLAEAVEVIEAVLAICDPPENSAEEAYAAKAREFLARVKTTI